MIWLGNQPRRSACRKVTLAVAALAFSSSALAQDPEAGPEVAESTRVFVEYAAEDGCPSQTLFEGALYFRSPRVAFASSPEGADVRAQVKIHARKGGYAGVLELSEGQGAPTTRTLEGSRCGTVVEALSLAAALLLDPTGVRTAPLPSASELEELAEKARAEAPVEPSPAPPPPPAPAPAPKPAPKPEARPAPPAAREPLRLGLGLRGGAFTAVHDVDGLAGASIELGIPSPSLEATLRLGALVSNEHEVTASAGTVTYLPVEVQAGGCLGPKPARFELGLCFDTALLLLSVDAPESDVPRPSLRLLPSLDLSPRVAYRLGNVALGLEVGAGVHLTAEHFRIEPEGEVFSLPRIFGRGILFLRFDVPVGEDPAPRAGSASASDPTRGLGG